MKARDEVERLQNLAPDGELRENYCGVYELLTDVLAPQLAYKYAVKIAAFTNGMSEKDVRDNNWASACHTPSRPSEGDA